jgi:hypothetical protein
LKKVLLTIVLLAGALAPPASWCVAQTAAWPEPTQSSRPWTRWWWHGSAVDDANLTRLLEEYRRVGLGGVEITCIYGVKGEPHPNRPYRSDEWREAIRHTLDEATRLGMGVDLPAGSGWRMGDPELPIDLANSRLVLNHRDVVGPDELTIDFDEKLTPQAATATAADGRTVDLTPHLDGNRLVWSAPKGEWRIDTAAYRWAGDKVKRPGPGGAGLNINPFWRKSVQDFLNRFARDMPGFDGVRAQFHDSFEYEGDWQPEFFDEFATRRGYRLEVHLAELAGERNAERVGRVKADYRLTLDDLVREDLIGTWNEWSHAHGMLTRNQSHGSPANWLDLYAAVDIPEIESFGRLTDGDADPLVLKFASSAANVAGKKLVSAETATWLDEHFNVTLAQVKQNVDRLLLAGVNHVVYHGTAYSPDDAAWPGWLFYASTQFNPQNPIWRDFPALNQYVTRLQSVLQATQPDGDVLLYWPISDLRHDPKGLRQDFRVHNSHHWFTDQPIGAAAQAMQERGVTFDYVSDRLLEACQPSDDGVVTPGGAVYRAVVVPRAEHMPLESIRKLAELAEAGCPVMFWGGLPQGLPGLQGADDAQRWSDLRKRFSAAAKRLEEKALQGEDLPALLSEARVRSERWAAANGVGLLRRQRDDGVVYLLCNQRDEAIDAWIEPGVESDGAVLMDAVTGRIGAAAQEMTGEHNRRVRLQLEPHETVLLVMTADPVTVEPWRYRDQAGEATTLRGWSVTFIDGGPTKPASFESADPRPWTDLINLTGDDPWAESFAGTARYACEFNAPKDANRYRLDLGEVLGSASVRLNDKEIGTLIGPSFAIDINRLQPTGNRLEIDVTGVAANRLRDLDRRGVVWRIFEDINIVGIDYRPLDASHWPVRPLGLRGPVRITPLRGD